MRHVVRNAGFGCAIVFAAPFAFIGIGSLIGAARAYAGGAPGDRVVMLVCLGVAFAGSGFAVVLAAIRGRKRVLADAELELRHPHEPWMWNPEWASRRVSDQSRLGTWMLWIFAILWNAIATPLLLVVPGRLREGESVLLIALLFPIVGLALIAAAVRATLRALRFHSSTLVLDTLPAPIGGALHGRVEVAYAPLADAESIVVRLRAVDRRQSGKSTTETIVWQEEYEVPRGALTRTMNGVAIPIAVAIPDDAPQTKRDMPQTIWRLNVDAEVPGVDYTATFEVPVFRTATPMPLRAVPPHTPPPEPRAPEGFVVAQTAAGRELRFPPFRAKAFALSAVAILLLWCGVVAALFTSDAPFFFKLIFALFALPLVFFAAELLFGSGSVTLAGENVIVRRRLLFASSTKTVARGDIASAKAKIGAQSGSRPYYDVELRTRDGKSIKVAKYLRSKREAEWVAAQIHGR